SSGCPASSSMTRWRKRPWSSRAARSRTPPPTHRRTKRTIPMWRSFAGALAAIALALAPAWAEDSYPVTVEHAFGETVIEEFPERIVTLSWMSQEAIIALGESPVAIQHQI